MERRETVDHLYRSIDDTHALCGHEHQEHEIMYDYKWYGRVTQVYSGVCEKCLDHPALKEVVFRSFGDVEL